MVNNVKFVGGCACYTEKKKKAAFGRNSHLGFEVLGGVAWSFIEDLVNVGDVPEAGYTHTRQRGFKSIFQHSFHNLSQFLFISEPMGPGQKYCTRKGVAVNKGRRKKGRSD